MEQTVPQSSGAQPAFKRVDRIELADATFVDADTTVLALGWQVPAYTEEERDLALADASGRLVWVAPGNPIEQPLERIPDASTVVVRGLGMGFFDAMAMLTLERGGRFVKDASARSGLRYEPSGREPHLLVTSGRGYPFLPKSDYRALPPRAALPRLREAIKRLNGASTIDFEWQVWPAIVRDAYEAYYEVLACQRPAALRAPLEAIVRCIDASEIQDLDAALAPMLADPKDALRLHAWISPLKQTFANPEELTEFLGSRLSRDIAEASAGQRSPIKAALWSVSASRKPAAILGAQGRYAARSRAKYREFQAFGQMVGSGPPLLRSRQLLALVDAGLVTFLGAQPSVTLPDSGGCEVSSPTTNTTVTARVLVDAWMHRPDCRRPGDSLAVDLAKRARPFMIPGRHGVPEASGSPEVLPRTRQLVGRDGRPDPRLHLVGIPTYAQLPDTTISPIPGTDALMLQETDAVAAHMLDVIGVSRQKCEAYSGAAE